MENVEVWSKVCLPAIRTTQVQSNYQGKAVFEHPEIRFVALKSYFWVVNHFQTGSRRSVVFLLHISLMIIFVSGDFLRQAKDISVEIKIKCKIENCNVASKLDST